MKKGLALIGIVAIAVAVYFIFFDKSISQKEDPKQQALVVQKNSPAFNQSFNELLNSYYGVSAALVEWDTASADKQAEQLATIASGINFNELKGDSAIVSTAKVFAENIASEAKAIVGEPAIEGKRRSFYTLSDNLYNLIRTVQYDQSVIYHVKCPMAFNDNEEAFWISAKNEIVNPYLGTKHPVYHSGMLHCGSVEDSLDFRKNH